MTLFINVPQKWTTDAETDAIEEGLIASWHDVERFRGVDYPVLFYTVRRDRLRIWHAQTEPCIYCGQRHRHGADDDGNGDGSRVPHCGDHTHEFTPTGRRRTIYAHGAVRCHGHHRDYILRRPPP